MQKNLYRRVGDNRWRESVGLYYEDFEPDVVIEHRPGRTILDADNVWFTTLTMNQHPLHFDAQFARHTEWRQPLVNSCLTLAMVTGMSVPSTSRNAVSNLGWDKIRLTAPVFVGDTIYGNAPRIGGPPLHLHSREIVVPLYKNRAPIKVMAPVPLATSSHRVSMGVTSRAIRS